MRTFNICEADVEDKEQLAIFRNKILELQNIFDFQEGIENVHTITSQYQDLIWYDTVYRTYNEARRISSENETPDIGLQGTLIELIDKTFFESQAMGIRRLTDKHEWSPIRSVNSLPSIIENIRSIANIFTRENYICYTGYKYLEISQDWKVAATLEHKQKQFDFISSSSSNRDRKDKIDLNILKDLEKKFRSFDLIRLYTNKYLAHASNARNRINIDSKLQEVTLLELEKCYKSIIHIAKVIAIFLDTIFISELPVAQFDQLSNWDKPFILPEQKKDLDQYWYKRANMFRKWGFD